MSEMTPHQRMYRNEQQRRRDVVERTIREITRELDALQRTLTENQPYLGDSARRIVAEAGRLADRAGALDALTTVEHMVFPAADLPGEAQ